jgi:phosphate/sulfate permease
MCCVEQANRVIWELAAHTTMAWVMTIPATVILGETFYLLFVAIL